MVIAQISAEKCSLRNAASRVKVAVFVLPLSLTRPRPPLWKRFKDPVRDCIQGVAWSKRRETTCSAKEMMNQNHKHVSTSNGNGRDLIWCRQQLIICPIRSFTLFTNVTYVDVSNIHICLELVTAFLLVLLLYLLLLLRCEVVRDVERLPDLLGWLAFFSKTIMCIYMRRISTYNQK